MADKKSLTTNFGAPLPDNQHSLTAGERGPVLLQDYFLIEKLAHFDRETPRTSSCKAGPRDTRRRRGPRPCDARAA